MAQPVSQRGKKDKQGCRDYPSLNMPFISFRRALERLLAPKLIDEGIACALFRLGGEGDRDWRRDAVDLLASHGVSRLRLDSPIASSRVGISYSARGDWLLQRLFEG